VIGRGVKPEFSNPITLKFPKRNSVDDGNETVKSRVVLWLGRFWQRSTKHYSPLTNQSTPVSVAPDFCWVNFFCGLFLWHGTVLLFAGFVCHYFERVLAGFTCASHEPLFGRRTLAPDAAARNERPGKDWGKNRERLVKAAGLGL